MIRNETGSLHLKSLLSRYGIVLGAASVSVIGSVAYACMMVGPHSWYSFWRQIVWIGMPGILLAGVPMIALEIGLPLGEFLVVATTVNFFLYLGLGLSLRKLVRVFSK